MALTFALATWTPHDPRAETADPVGLRAAAATRRVGPSPQPRQLAALVPRVALGEPDVVRQEHALVARVETARKWNRRPLRAARRTRVGARGVLHPQDRWIAVEIRLAG